MKILIANRGEIAVRIIKTCQEMGIHTVAIHSTADAKAMHVRIADEAICIGPPAIEESYLNMMAILSAADVTGVDAIHPGTGLLSENYKFARAVVDCGFIFIGPNYQSIAKMSNKIEAKKVASKYGLNPITSFAANISCDTYPVIVKSECGGGGRAMFVANNKIELTTAIQKSQLEASTQYGTKNVYLEEFVHQPLHIEVQILADMHGNVLHFYDRECSIQRRNQKIIEESGCNFIDTILKKNLFDSVKNMIRAIKYVGLGTCEFLYKNGKFHFMEMNTRLQIEHTVTEMWTGIDLVREQILVAMGDKLTLQQDDICHHGHVIECRINTENPQNLTPSFGHITEYHAPCGNGVRIDSDMYRGTYISPYYDNMIAKVIVKDRDRLTCIHKMMRALKEYVIEGVQTNIPLLQRILQHSDFVNYEHHTQWLQNHIDNKWQNN